ncbi:hypothetical protein TH53_19900 [Pedobacter lusitanus]|uniref:Uncharacterized protein n=1 Tax=Pedobacter lusitanus TaxID=1503925 RepID=A0A0D0FT32_9SPHI|nr:hypothetical protein [Pedobacter lusitanus]KIO75604.1 hypothetical protein TH53_19900 [Pedobacter lusitanus]
MKSLLSKKDHSRRYYLHGIVKKHFIVNSHNREVSVTPDTIDLARENKYLMELCAKFGYNIQMSIV